MMFYGFFLFFFMNSNSMIYAQDCSVSKTPESYLELRKTVDLRINSFAQMKAIAKKADETLEKLIKAKSPIIQNWMSKRNLNSKTEEEIVKEWRKYFAENFILSKYPQGSMEVDQEIEKLFNEMNKLFFSARTKERIEGLFTKGKAASLKVISQLSLSDDLKKKISARISEIQIYWMKEFKTSKFQKHPLEFLDWGVAYDPSMNEINIGIRALEYPNDETLLAVFSHEIGHSVDSCRWGAFMDGVWPFEKVGKCLRSASSVGAKSRDDSQMNALIKSGKLSADIAAGLKANTTCNKSDYPPIGVQADQLPESFADWFSAETVARIEDMNVNQLRSDLCNDSDLNPGSSYPSNRSRLLNIYYVQPDIKKRRKDTTKSDSTYCSFSSENNK